MENVLIIINFNDFNRVKDLVVFSISMGLYSKILIVDNRSSDGSADSLTSFFSGNSIVYVIRNEKNEGYGRGNNLGLNFIKKSGWKPMFVTLINSDVLYKKECVLQCIQTLQSNSLLACCTPRMLGWDGKVEMNCWPYSNFAVSLSFCFYLFGRDNRSKYFLNLSKGDVNIVDVIRGTLAVYRYDVFEKVGFFDENTFLYWEEDCLSQKFKKEGYSEALCTSCSFVHNHKIRKMESISYKKKMSQYRLFGQSMLYYNKKYNHLSNFKIFLLKLAIFWNFIEKTILIFFYDIFHFFKKI
jgi:GT2 family glycosyltransferase